MSKWLTDWLTDYRTERRAVGTDKMIEETKQQITKSNKQHNSKSDSYIQFNTLELLLEGSSPGTHTHIHTHTQPTGTDDAYASTSCRKVNSANVG